MTGLIANLCKNFLKITKHERTSVRNFLFSREKPKAKTALDNYQFIQPEREEFNQVYRLMEKYFFAEESTIKSLNAGSEYHPVLEKEVYETLEYGYSYVAKCKWTNCMIGACLNFSTSEEYPEVLRKYACTVKDEKIRQILMFYAYILDAPNIFEKYCENQAFAIRAVVVDKDNRSLGVARELIRRSGQLGKDLAFPIIRCDCTALSLANSCEALGMHLEHEFQYCQYLGFDNKPVFDPAPPNNMVKTYIDLPLRLKKGRK